MAASLLCACSQREPPPPANHKAETLQAWASKFAPADQTWRYVSLNDVSALYLDKNIAKDQYPLIAYRMKYENFEGAEAGGHRFRSTLVSYHADCARLEHQITRVTAFERLGLQGARFEAENPTPDWETPQIGSDGYKLTALACTLAQPARYAFDDPRLIPFEPQAITAEEIAASVWVRQNRLDDDGWTMISSGEVTAEFISERNFDFEAYPRIRYDAKTEFFMPVPVESVEALSELRRVDVDCEKHSTRDLATTVYEGQNLKGAETKLPGPGPWSPPVKGALPLSPSIACIFAYDLIVNRELTNATAAGKDLF